MHLVSKKNYDSSIKILLTHYVWNAIIKYSIALFHLYHIINIIVVAREITSYAIKLIQYSIVYWQYTYNIIFKVLIKAYNIIIIDLLRK